ncbi:MAG TPA: gamma carbonic anhydrase family protein [Micromonosporaceae bacterium]|jgi:carbonic anhydrase/acetyltransferase-like protein (isoleucine patch superfamily)
MLIRHRGAEPTVDRTAWVAPTATLVGDVRIGPRTRILYGAVLDAEGAHIEIGQACVVGEHAVLRATAVGDQPRPVILGDHVFVSPHATLLGCAVERCAYVATGATILHGAHLAAGAVAAVGALVHANTVVPPEFFVPPLTIAVGDPVVVLTPDRMDEVAAAIKDVNFAATAFGVDTAWEDRIRRYERITEVRVAEFAAHDGDVEVTPPS